MLGFADCELDVFLQKGDPPGGVKMLETTVELLRGNKIAQDDEKEEEKEESDGKVKVKAKVKVKLEMPAKDEAGQSPPLSC